MPQPSNQQVHVNAILSNISVAYQQDTDGFVSTKVFPIVPVEKKSDLYFKYDKGDWFRDQAQYRAPGTPSAGSGYGLNQDDYACKTYAFHKDIDEETRANSDAPLNPDNDATQFVTDILLLRQEIQWANDYFQSGIWANDWDTDDGSGVPGTSTTIPWDDYTNSQPLLDVAFGIKTIVSTTGKKANTLVIGYDVYTALLNHPILVDRIKYTTEASVTTDVMARYFNVDTVLVASAIQNTAQEGATDDFSFILGGNALLCYVEPNPGIMKVSAGYTFEWTGISGGLGLTTAIKKFPILELNVDRIEGEISYVNKVVAADVGVFWTGLAS